MKKLGSIINFILTFWFFSTMLLGNMVILAYLFAPGRKPKCDCSYSQQFAIDLKEVWPIPAYLGEII